MILKFRVYEQTISLQSTKAEPRQGSKDYLELQFSFSSDWNDLLKYVYIQHGEVSVPHDLVGGSIIVDEYFTEQTEFNVTLFGKSADGSVEVPTNVVTVFLQESNNLWVKDAPEPQNSWLVQVVDARDEALAAAIRAENAAIHQPYPNAETGTWWVWDADSGAYKDTGVSVDSSITVDSELSDTSENPVQNKVIKSALDKLGVQPDWNQNDSTAADYVKNRPFYTGDLVETEIFDLVALMDAAGYRWLDNDGFKVCGYVVYGDPLYFDTPLVAGDRYKISYNGETGEYPAIDGANFDNPGLIYICDAHDLSEINPGDIHFIVACAPYTRIDSSDTSGRWFIYLAQDYTGTVPTELKVIEKKQEIKKIDKIFLPDVPDGSITEEKLAQDVKAKLSKLSEEIVSTAESKVAWHNTGTDAHNDIRLLIQGLTDRLNALADSDDTTLDQLSEVVAYIKSNRELISAITTDKVGVADIVNDLVTNVANKPLSAAQGVALKALIDAISVPDKLPNPNALTFSGAVTGTYDGSAPLTVEIPSWGGSGSSENWRLVNTVTTTEDVADIRITQDSDGNPLSLQKVKIFSKVRGNSVNLSTWCRITANNLTNNFYCDLQNTFAATEGQDYYNYSRADFAIYAGRLMLELLLRSANNAASKNTLWWVNNSGCYENYPDVVDAITSIRVWSASAGIGAGTELIIYGVDA